MPAINTKFTTPSTYSNHDDQGGLFTFLSNKDFKHLYHKMMGAAEKHAKRQATVWFLSQCIDLKLIPKTFVISNQSQSQDNNVQTDWRATSLEASLNLLQIALDKEKVEEEKCFEETDYHLRVLVILAQETNREAVIEELKNRLQKKGDYFKTREMMIKEKKLNFLKTSSSKTSVTSQIHLHNNFQHHLIISLLTLVNNLNNHI